MPRRKRKTTRSVREQPYQPSARHHSRSRSTNPIARTEIRHVVLSPNTSISGQSPQSAAGILNATPSPQPVPDRQFNRPTRRRHGIFPFLSLPLEIRQMVYHLVLIPIGDKLVTLHFGHFMPGLGGPRYNQNILRVCHAVRREALALLYSGAIYIRGFDLVDFSSSLRLSQHPWLRGEVRPIKSLRVRFSLLAREAEFEGNSDVFLRTLPQCRMVRVDLVDEEDCEAATRQSFTDFVRALRLEGVDVVLKDLRTPTTARDRRRDGLH